MKASVVPESGPAVDLNRVVEDEEIEDVSCPECESSMEYWNAEKTKVPGLDESLDSEGEVFIMWQEKDCAKAAFFWCQDCEILMVTHKQCGSEMVCVGHQGYARTGSENMRDSKTGMKAHLSNPKPYDPNKPRYELYDVLSNKIRVEEWWPAGPKGDAKHFWMCQTCKVQFSFSAVPVK